MTSVKNQGFTLVELLVVIGILGILAGALFPAISNAVMKANMTAVGSRGRDIFIAITGANTEREPLGLGNVWPKNQTSVSSDSSGDKDIADTQYSDSCKYFTDLYDGTHAGTKDHSPYVAGFDYSKLAGAGVKVYAGTSELPAENNMWTIAGDVRDEMEDILPVLVTRNFVCTELRSKITGTPPSTQITTLGSVNPAPFGNKGFVIIRKGGGVFNGTTKYARLNVIYQNQAFDTTAGNSSGIGITYLAPKCPEKPAGG